MKCCNGNCQQGRLCPARAELPTPTKPVEQLDQWAARLSWRAVFLLLVVSASASAIGYFSR